MKSGKKDITDNAGIVHTDTSMDPESVKDWRIATLTHLIKELMSDRNYSRLEDAKRCCLSDRVFYSRAFGSNASKKPSGSACG